MKIKDYKYYEFLNVVYDISTNINSLQQNFHKIILKNYDITLLNSNLDKEIASLDKLLVN